MNNQAIKLVEGKQPAYGPIYSLGPVEVETLKPYIETHLKTGFIRLSKSPSETPILFDQKPDGILPFYVDYRGLNNPTIKNWYLLPLIEGSLNQLDRERILTKLNMTSAYHRMRIGEGDEYKTAFGTWYSYFGY